MVQELLDFKNKLDLVIEEAFNKNEKFIIAMKVKHFFLSSFSSTRFLIRSGVGSDLIVNAK